MFGCAFASYAAPYSSGEKYQTSQYIIDSPIRFGLVILAFLIVAQGACLIFLAATNCHSEKVELKSPIIAELKLPTCSVRYL